MHMFQSSTTYLDFDLDIRTRLLAVCHDGFVLCIWIQPVWAIWEGRHHCPCLSQALLPVSDCYILHASYNSHLRPRCPPRRREPGRV